MVKMVIHMKSTQSIHWYFFQFSVLIRLFLGYFLYKINIEWKKKHEQVLRRDFFFSIFNGTR